MTSTRIGDRRSDEVERSASTVKAVVPGLDGLRAIACLAVFGVHFQQLTGFSGSFAGVDIKTFLANGHVAVALFFVLSGFVVGRSLWRTQHAPDARDSPGAFLLRRLARIGPAYFACLIALVLATAHFRSPAHILDTSLHLLFLHNYTEDSFYSLNAPFWTVGIQAQFYLVFALLLGLRRRVSFTAGQLAAGLFVSALISYMLHLMVMARAFNATDWKLPFWFVRADGAVLAKSVLAHLPLFILGILSAGVFSVLPSSSTRGAGRKAIFELVFWASLAAVIMILTRPDADTIGVAHGRYGMPVLPTLIAAAIISAPHTRIALALLDFAPIRWLGTISFGVFIYHLPVMELVSRLLTRAGYPPAQDWMLFGSASLALSLAVAVMSFFMFEQPIRRWVDRASRRGTPRPNPPSIETTAGTIGRSSTDSPRDDFQAGSNAAPLSHDLDRQTNRAPLPSSHPAPAKGWTWLSSPWVHAYRTVVVAYVLYFLATAVGHVVPNDWSALGWMQAGFSPPWWALCFWGLCLVSLTLIPEYPPIAVFAFVAMAYGTPRYHGEYGYMTFRHVLEAVSLLSVLGLAARSLARGDPIRWRLPALAWLMVVLMLWIAVSVAGVFIRGETWRPWISHHPAHMLNALGMFLVAWWSLSRQRDVMILGVLLACILSVRATLSPYSIWRDGDIAGVFVMSLSLLSVVFLSECAWPWRLVGVVLSLNLLRLMQGAENRGAGIALVVAALVLWWLSRRKWLWLAIATPVIAGGTMMFLKTSYFDRFVQAWSGRGDAESGLERIEIWKAGWRMYNDHPIFGVGPGQFPNHIAEYNAGLPLKVAHNSLINMLCETGAPGLALYSAFFALAMFLLWRVWRVMLMDWPAPGARAVFVTLCAYLVLGMFITRHDMTLAYIICGIALAFHRQIFSTDVVAHGAT